MTTPDTDLHTDAANTEQARESMTEALAGEVVVDMEDNGPLALVAQSREFGMQSPCVVDER